jgi:asparagine synthase (glutamine-hydrolysing)
MCGIAGIFAHESGAPVAEEVLHRMCGAMIHRGPDDEGLYVSGPVGLGMRRLSIVDLVGGHQPLANEDETVWVVCNGEIYNAPELRDELAARGHRFRCRSDVEVIPHLYEELGPACVERLRGMFGLALWDAHRRRLLLARDRVGIKPLYYAAAGGRLVFGSEAKAVLAAGVDRTIDPQALHDYLSLGYVPAPRSMFAGVHKLPPAHVLVCEAGGGVRVERYWDVPRPAPNGNGASALRGGADEYAERLRAVLTDAVRCHLLADVPVGVFLSGGLDSSTIVALMRDLGVGRLRTFTIGFAERSFSEADEARLVAERFGTEHHELTVRPDAIALVADLVRAFDEPFADSSALPVYYVSQLARQHVKVVLSGEGGDEVLAGYETYLAAKLARLYRRLPGMLARTAVPGLIRRLPVSHARVSFDYKAKRFVTGALLPPAAGHLWWKVLLDEDVKAALYRESPGAEPTVRLFEELFAASGGDDLDRLQYVDTRLYLPDDILVKVDRMSMAHSLEARVPFLDHHVIAFARTIPTGLRIRGITKKYLLRRAMADRLPRSVITGKKRGFNVPLPAWIRGELRGFFRDHLGPEALRSIGLFDAAVVGRLLADHEAMRADHSRPLWALLMFVLWHRAFRPAAHADDTGVRPIRRMPERAAATERRAAKSL